MNFMKKYIGGGVCMNIYEICVIIATLVFVALGFYSVKLLINLSKVANSTSNTIDHVNQSTINHINESLDNIAKMTQSIETDTLRLVNRNLENITDVTDLTREKIEMVASLVDKLSVIGDALDQLKSILSFVKNIRK